jgi:hypothetical protein
MPDTEANPDLPGPFQDILKGGPLPPVDAKDLKLTWEFYRDVGKHAGAIDFRVLEEVCSPGANVFAVWGRVSMLSMLSMLVQNGQLLDPWRHGEVLDDVVFRVSATFPMEGMKRGVVYSGWPFDVDGFLQRLRQESGGTSAP